ncbi:MAG: hypothetical protein C0404_07595 [Verrucomicrobia bacterium]|nr:hypothetical protein [Verrucomicrobiota bacterium]
MLTMQKFLIRGSRGTMPSCGVCSLRHGGHTTCFSLDTEDGMIIVDAGSGITHINSDLAGESRLRPMTILFTHFHLDHVIGLPAFEPFYKGGSEITIMADRARSEDWRIALQTFMGKPYWPVGLGETSAQMKLVDLPAPKRLMSLYGVQVSWMPVPHPQQCLAYRLTTSESSVVIATDVEYPEDGIPAEFVNFCADADFLVFDAHFTPAEQPLHRGWGHSTWAVAVQAAIQSHVRRLVLTHHAPTRSDSELTEILHAARRVFPKTFLASENTLLSPASFGPA